MRKTQEEIMEDVLAELALENADSKNPTVEESERRLKNRWEKRQTPVKRAALFLIRFFKNNKANNASIISKMIGIK